MTTLAVIHVESVSFAATPSELSKVKGFYDTNGYVVVGNLFTDKELAPVRQRLTDITENPASAPKGVAIGRESDTIADKSKIDGKNRSVRNISFMVRYDPTFQEFARNPKLLDVTRALIGPRVKVFRDQALLKPPGGQAKPSHQDQSYFRVQPPDGMVTAWVAIDDATTENGCMMYVPQSHKHGLFEIKLDPQRPVHHLANTGDLEFPCEVLCPVTAGSVIFHHGYTLHRSDVNQTQTWRRSVQLHYATAEATSEHARLNTEISLQID